MAMLAHFIEKVIKGWQHWTSTPFPTAKLSLFRKIKSNNACHLGSEVIGCTGIPQGALFPVSY